MARELFFRFVIQRVSSAEVVIAGNSCGKIAQGLLVLLGVGTQEEIGQESTNDPINISTSDVEHEEKIVLEYLPTLTKCVTKILGLRIFTDAEGKMNLSLRDVAGSIYVISQFTLFADCQKGYRPGFSAAAKPNLANKLYQKFVELCKQVDNPIPVFTGEFAADMQVSLCNSGPVTIIIEADKRGIK